MLLFLYHPFSLEDPLCRGEVQIIIYLHFSPNCSEIHSPYVFQAKFILLSRSRQNDLAVLYSSDSSVKPSGLQPKKQGCETSPGAEGGDLKDDA